MSEVGHYFLSNCPASILQLKFRPYSPRRELCLGSGPQTSTRWDQREQQWRVSQPCEGRRRLLTVVHGKNGAAIFG